MSDNVFYIVVLGSSNSGKNELILRLTREIYDPEYIPTIQDYFEKKIVIDNVEYQTRIIDTAGQDEMQGITDVNIKDAQAAIIVYSVTNKASFDEVDKFRDKFRSFSHDDNLNIVLVGTKCESQERSISQEQGKNKAHEWGDVPFFESSAKNDINVQEPFVTALKLILGKKSNNKPDKKSRNGKNCLLS